MSEPVPTGVIAPDFTLQDQHGQDASLSALRGRPVLLIFYPLAFSGVCSGELAQLRDRYTEFVEYDTVVLAVSVDSTFALRTWSDREGFPFALLSDVWPPGAGGDSDGGLDTDGGGARRGTVRDDA